MNTTISISKETRGLLREFGRKSESYDDVIKRMFNDLRLQQLHAEYVDSDAFVSIDDAKEWTKLKIKADD